MVTKRGNKRRNLLFICISLAVFALVSVLITKSSPPQILSASVYPLKIMPGQVMIVTVQAKDSFGIKSAVAIFGNEKMPDERNMPVITGTKRDGVYETRWIAHDTKNQKWYNTTIIFTNILGKKTQQSIEWQDPTVTHKADEITAGTFGAGDYVFPGNLTVNKAFILNQTSSPSNNTGFGKIYYKQNDIDSYTKLLSHFDGVDGATSYTAETGQTVTFVGTAQLDTAQKKFGTASLLLDGNSDYVTVPNSADFDMGSSDLTIDFWAKTNDASAFQIFVSKRDSTAGPAQYLFWLSEGVVTFRFTNTIPTQYTAAGSLFDTNWHHFAAIKYGSNIYLAIDGTLSSPTAVTGTMLTSSQPLVIGAQFDGSAYQNFFNGWLDEVRISKGIARWTSTFTPPTSAYITGETGGLVFQYQNGTTKLLAGE